MDHERVDLCTALRRQVAANGDRPCVTSAVSGETLTYGEFDAAVNRVANALLGLGAAVGSPVNVMLPNGIEYMTVSYALKKLGAIEVAINAEFRGSTLARMLSASGAETLVTSASLSGHLAAIAGEVAVPAVAVVVEDTEPAAEVRARRVIGYRELEPSGRADDPGTAIDELAPATVVFTSGTTGVSKGCVLPHRALVRNAQLMVRELELGEDDCVYGPYPLFHVHGAYLDVAPALMVGAHAVIAPRFAVDGFWEHVHRYGVSSFSMNGSAQTLLWKAEPSALERGHRLRVAWGGPLPVDREQFEGRFGVRVLPADGVFGMSETGMVSMSSPDPRRSGRVQSSHEVRIADGNDDPLPAGEVGEILVRSREPGAMFSGYLGRPEATVEANRNFWFHTGDLGSLDGDGRLSFIGRKREMIGSSSGVVSASSIEGIVDQHPAVLESAAIGVRTERDEEEVRLYVVTRDGAALGREELLAFCRDRLAPFMVPRDVELVAELPKTPTGKIAKARLALREEART